MTDPYWFVQLRDGQAINGRGKSFSAIEGLQISVMWVCHEGLTAPFPITFPDGAVPLVYKGCGFVQDTVMGERRELPPIFHFGYEFARGQLTVSVDHHGVLRLHAQEN